MLITETITSPQEMIATCTLVIHVFPLPIDLVFNPLTS